MRIERDHAAGRERDPNEVSARNNQDLEKLKELLDGPKIMGLFRNAAASLRENPLGDGKSLDQLVDLDIWAINLFIPGELFTDTTSLTAISGVIVQPDNMEKVLEREERECSDPGDYTPRPSYYILLFQPTDSDEPYIFTGLDPVEAADLPYLSTVLGVDRKRMELDGQEYRYIKGMVVQDLIDFVAKCGEHEVSQWPKLTIPREIKEVESGEQVKAIDKLFGVFKSSKRRLLGHSKTEVGPYRSGSVVCAPEVLDKIAGGIEVITKQLGGQRMPELNP